VAEHLERVDDTEFASGYCFLICFGAFAQSAVSQSLMVLSRLPVARYLPSGEKATQATPYVCPSSLKSSFPAAMSHTLAARSYPPDEARRPPSGEKTTDSTPDECPLSVKSSFPPAMSQSLMVVSSLPEARRLPSGEKVAQYTLHECPLKRRDTFPVAKSQRQMERSRLAETRRRPSGEKATEYTSS
jgi:hypothetical protein